MPLLDIAGGAAQGYVRGDQDIQRRREFEAMQNQRKRVEQQQKIDDTLTEKLKGVRPEGDYDTFSAAEAPGGEGPDTGVPLKPLKTGRVKRSAADVARERAGVYSTYGGRLQDMQASAQQQQLASQLEAATRAEEHAKNQDALNKAGMMISMGNPHGAVRHMANYANQMPELEGRQYVVEDRNGVPHLAIAEGGRFISPPRPITPQVAQEMYDKGVEMLSPENRLKGRELGIHQMTAEAAMQQAATALRKVDYEISALGPAHIKLMQDQGYALRTRADADKAAAGMGKFGQVISGKDPSTGNAIYMVVDTRTGEPKRLDFGPNFVPDKAAQATQDLTPRQKAKIEIHKAKAALGYGASGGYRSAAEEENALNDILGEGGGGTIGTLNANAPKVNKPGYGPTADTSQFAASFGSGQVPSHFPSAPPKDKKKLTPKEELEELQAAANAQRAREQVPNMMDAYNRTQWGR